MSHQGYLDDLTKVLDPQNTDNQSIHKYPGFKPYNPGEWIIMPCSFVKSNIKSSCKIL